MKYAQTPYKLIFRRYGAKLAIMSCLWFLYNFIAYINHFGLYAAILVNNVTGGSDALSSILGWNVVITQSLFSIPGTIGGAFVVDRIGPKNTLATVGFIMAGLYKQLTNHIVAFAGLTLKCISGCVGTFISLGEFGPGNCAYILGSKSFPTAIRGQSYSVAAIAGNVGVLQGLGVILSSPTDYAFLTQSNAIPVLPLMIDAFGGPGSDRGNTGPFWISGGGQFISRPLGQDGMAKEDKEFREYLEANGYDTSNMGLRTDEEKVIEGGAPTTAGSYEMRGRRNGNRSESAHSERAI
ncbi:hypothetical protein BD779DRAFT_1605300 [Infundibulicybe gibba]|nr:hypothetical protein BD779DRAFT_1605300 [Infundibulicybe gibba]